MSKIGIITILAVMLLTVTKSLAGFAPIIDFPGKATWRASPDSPKAVNTSNGVKFPCAFNAKTSRVYWDCPVTADLSKSLTVELELSCPDSEKVQSVGLYLKSGDGWYLWIQPLVKSGRQKFFFQVQNASTEGKPSGWNKITGVRISFQNNSSANSFMILHGLKAGTSGIILVKGTTSLPNKGERSVAKKTTARIGKWLEDTGVAHSVLDDEDISAGRVRSAAIIILPYNPRISDREMNQLEKLSANGTKIIVFYGSNPRLAELLGMRLGKYHASSTPGQWSSFAFNRSAPEGTPPRVIQESGNIYTVFPKSKNSKIIAYWQNASGKTCPDPAWVQSNKGSWMTHILLGEDSENKKRMLLAILGHYEKGVWKNAAQTALEQTKGSAGAGRQALTTSWKKGDYIAVVSGTGKLRKSAVINSVRNQDVKGNEFRGVWDHSGMGLYPGDWGKTIRILARSGVTAVFPNMLWAGAAHFSSKYVNRIDKSKPFGDQMAQCVKAAHAAGLKIHVWKVCWNLAMASNEFKERARKQGRLQKNKRNETQNWLCPSDPANIALELNTILEVLRRYDVDGIHLDYIRYPDNDSCYCAGCRKRFEKWTGHPVANWPMDIASGRQSKNYKRWRKTQITSFVRTVRREMKKIKPTAKLSAAVYPKYPECADSIGQDWGLWLKEGTMDFVCPMDYFPSVSSFREILNRQLTITNGNKRIYPGIGATLDTGDLGNEIFIGQLRALRERRFGGFILFDLNPSLAANFLPLIGGK